MHSDHVALENSPENYIDLDVGKRAWNYQVVVAFFFYKKFWAPLKHKLQKLIYNTVRSDANLGT